MEGVAKFEIFYTKWVAKVENFLHEGGCKISADEDGGFKGGGGCTFSTDLGPCLGMTETDNVCIVPWLKISANLPRDIFEYGSGFSG